MDATVFVYPNQGRAIPSLSPYSVCQKLVTISSPHSSGQNHKKV